MCFNNVPEMKHSSCLQPGALQWYMTKSYTYAALSPALVSIAPSKRFMHREVSSSSASLTPDHLPWLGVTFSAPVKSYQLTTLARWEEWAWDGYSGNMTARRKLGILDRVLKGLQFFVWEVLLIRLFPCGKTFTVLIEIVFNRQQQHK